MKFKEIRKLHWDNLYKLCVSRNWYTGGTNEQYLKLLNMTKNDNLTTEDIVEMAKDIIEHTPELVIDDLSRVCFMIAEKCNTFFEEI